MRRPIGATAMLVAASITLAGCGSGRSADRPGTLSGTLTVSAAASLTEVFTELAHDFESANTGVKVTLNLGSSTQLSEQVLSGAPVDLVAFADPAPMTRLSDAGLIDGQSRVFAHNKLAIVTKPGNPGHIETLADLGRASVGVIALCKYTVPCGMLADRMLQRARVTVDESRVTVGQDVKATLGAVVNGDAAAGIVYATDARSAGATVAVVDIPDDANEVATYPMAVVKGGNVRLAAAFEDFVSASRGRTVLQGYGFVE